MIKRLRYPFWTNIWTNFKTRGIIRNATRMGLDRSIGRLKKANDVCFSLIFSKLRAVANVQAFIFPTTEPKDRAITGGQRSVVSYLALREEVQVSHMDTEKNRNMDEQDRQDTKGYCGQEFSVIRNRSYMIGQNINIQRQESL
jgi:hypothetical protein